MHLKVNGEDKTVREELTVAQFLKELEVNQQLVVVEHNLTILKRDQLAQTTLHDGDQLEIVHMVGGGSLRATGDRGE